MQEVDDLLETLAGPKSGNCCYNAAMSQAHPSSDPDPVRTLRGMRLLEALPDDGVQELAGRVQWLRLQAGV